MLSRFVLLMVICFSGTTVRAGDTIGPVGEDQPYAGRVEKIVTTGIEDGQMPGAVVVVADADEIRYAYAFGHRRIEPEAEPMTLDTVFDLASLTKPVATATAVMHLVQDGSIDLNRSVADYLPEFKPHGKESIRVRDLLLHVGGLIPDNPLSDYNDDPEAAWRRICELKPIAAPGEKFAYTDVGFMVLGKLIERVSGKSLDRFCRDRTFEPLGMAETTFNPGESLRERAAPTEKRDGRWMTGEVHDPRAYRLGGVAGHAGLFSTAADLVAYGQVMLAALRGDGKGILKPSTVEQMTRPRKVPRGTRAFGWDHRSGYSRNRGEALSDAAFGHGGFTGTVLWIDPDKQIVFVFLSNRLHPDGKGTVNGLAGQIATEIAR